MFEKDLENNFRTSITTWNSALIFAIFLKIVGTQKYRHNKAILEYFLNFVLFSSSCEIKKNEMVFYSVSKSTNLSN